MRSLHGLVPQFLNLGFIFTTLEFLLCKAMNLLHIGSDVTAIDCELPQHYAVDSQEL